MNKMITTNKSRTSRFLLFFLISLVSILTASAVGEELLLDNYFFTGDVFFVDEYDFTVTLASDRSKIALEDGLGEYLFIQYGECETVNTTRFCFSTTLYDEPHDEYKAKIQIYTLEPVITVTQESDVASVGLDDEITVDVVIENTGEVDSTVCIFTQIIPDGFEIVSVTGLAEIDENYVRWRSPILSGTQKTFSYVLRAIESDAYSLQANCKYYGGKEASIIYSSALSLSVDAPALVTLTPNATSIEVGGVIEFDIIIENLAAQTISLDLLDVHIPASFIIEKFDSLLIQDSENLNHFTYSKDMSHNATLNFDFELRSTFDTVSDIDVDLTVSKDDVTMTLEDSSRITSEISDLIITPYYEPEVIFPSNSIITIVPENDKMSMEASQSGNFVLFIQNPSDDYTLTNITFIAESDLFFKTINVEGEIGPKSSKKVLDFNLTTPSITSSKTYEIDYTIKYSTSYGFDYKQEIEHKIAVAPVKDLEVDHDFDITKPEGGDTVKVTVSIKNNRELDLVDVQVTEIVPDVLEIKGASSTKVDLVEDSEVTAYEYYLVLPTVDDETTYDLVTSVMYRDGSNFYSFNITDDFDVKPRNPDIELKKSMESKEVTRGSISEIDYTLTNDDDFKVTDILIKFPAMEESYLVDEIEYLVDELIPGEEKTLTGIEKRIFLHNETSTSLNVPETIFLYNDDFDKLYSDSASKFSVKVSEATVALPFLKISKKVTDYDADTLSYIVTIENYGSIDAEIILHDQDEEVSLSIKSMESVNTSFTRNTSIVISNDYLVPISYLSFEDGGKTYYAITEEIDLDLDSDYFEVEVPEIPEVETPEVEVPEEPDTEDSEDEVNKEINSSDTEPDVEQEVKESLWSKIVNFFKNLFGGNK